MKHLRNMALSGVVLAAALSGCNKSSTSPDPEPEDTGTVISGTLSKDRTLTADKTWEFDGFVYVDSGVTLTLEPGTVVKSGGKSALMVQRGGYLVAKGTKEKPIVFTAKGTAPKPGDWAGIVLYGRAPVSTPDGTQSFEAIPEDVYGGDKADDSSGVLHYVRIEYAGYAVALDKELNGLTLGGVGSKTVLSYIQSEGGSDDAYEWFGGHAKGDHLIASGYQDDGFDIDVGYNGEGQYLLSLQTDSLGDKGIEAGSVALNSNQLTGPSFSNVTLVANSNNAGIHFKNNVTGSYKKMVLIGENTPSLIKVEGAATTEKLLDGTTKISDVFFDGVFTAKFETSDEGVKAKLEGYFTQADGALNADYTPKATAVKDAGAGAVMAGDLWYKGWTTANSIPDLASAGGGYCSGKGVVPSAAVISGHISKNTCLSADKTWEFEGFVYVDSGVTLTVEPGTVAKSGGKSALIIMRKAYLMANGSKEKPIVFTAKTSDPKPGDWAGLVIYGRAPVSTPDGTQAFEAIPEDTYGGDKADDSSGVLRYVRVEYAGYAVALDKELNGITFGGVGSKTVISYVQADGGSDDAFEWFGGHAKVDHLIASGYQDDGFDIDVGYNGEGMYMLSLQTDSLGDKGIEAGSVALNSNQLTSPTFSNVTLVANSNNAGIHFKNNVTGKYDKMVLIGNNTPSIIKVEGAATLEKLLNDDTKITKTFFDGSFKTQFETTDSGALALLPTLFTKADSALNDDYTPKATAVKDAEAGAVMTGDLWYKDWTRAGSIPTLSGQNSVAFCDGKGEAPAAKVITGHITKNTCLSADVTWEFSGFVYVDSGVTLTVEPGTKTKSGGKSALLIKPHGYIVANGTKEKPIVFTAKTADPKPGDWAGIVLYGRAPVSTPDGTQPFEAIPEDVYGGDKADDSSGVLRYVRVEYAGYAVALDKELNGITFGGVGSKTTLSYLQAHAGSDDAYEWFGGHAKEDHLIATGYQDDGFDIDVGYNGEGRYLFGIQTDSLSDKGIEAGSVALNPNQLTSPTFKNVTIVFNSLNAGLHFKNNVTGTYDKMVLIGTNTPKIIKIEGAATIEKLLDGTTKITNTFYDGTFTSNFDTADSSVAAVLPTMFTKVTGALNADYSAKDSSVVAAEAGAVLEGDLWYKDWTTPNSIPAYPPSL